MRFARPGSPSKILHKRQDHILKHNKKLPMRWSTGWPAACLAVIVSLSLGALTSRADVTSTSRGLLRIEAGTIVDASPGNEPTGRWNRIVLLARPRIASGDVDALSTAIRESVSKFVLTIMAAVERTVDPSSGRSSSLVWLIRQTSAGSNAVERDEAPRWIPPGFQEDRAIHVDGNQFNLLGVPNKKAFAIETLPLGKPIPWSAEALAVADLKKFDVGSLRQLSTALNNMLRARE